MNTRQAATPGGIQTGLAAALARGRAVLASWVDEGVVLPAAVFAAKRGVPVQALNAAVRRGDLFFISIKGRRYYVASTLQAEPPVVATICQALAGLEDMEKALFWLRPHGALGAQTVAAAISAGQLDRVVALANASAAQARASQRISRQQGSKPTDVEPRVPDA